MAGNVPSWELMFRSVWQSCRAQSRDCRGGTREENGEARIDAMKKETRKEKGREGKEKRNERD